MSKKKNLVHKGLKEQQLNFGSKTEYSPNCHFKLEGKYTEWPNPQKAENHACDRQSGLNDSAP